MGMKVKEPVGVSVQGEVNLTDDELIELFNRCVHYSKIDDCCADCPFKKNMYSCNMQKLHAQVVLLVKRQKKRIAELEEKKTVETAKERFLRMATLPQAEVDALFNAGRFNDIAVGYAKLAMVQLGYPFEKIQHVVKVMWQMFEDYRAESARTSSFVNAKGVRV
jgi:hypothetical protein